MTRSLALVLALAAAIPLAPSTASAGACARPEIQTLPLTADGTKLAKGGGVVMQMEDSAKAAKWTFAGTSKTPAKVRVIGPGLAVYEPPAAGAWTLQDDKGKASIRIDAGADAKAPPAPVVKAVQYRSSNSRRGTYQNVSAELAGQPPAGVVALLAYDEKGAVLSWGRINPGDPAAKSTHIAIWFSGSCTVLPNGTRAIGPDQKIKLAWLDASGQVSPAAAAKVVDASPKKSTIAPE